MEQKTTAYPSAAALDASRETSISKIWESLDAPSYVTHRPWVTFGGAILTGYFIGARTHKKARRHHFSGDQAHPYDDDDNLYAAAMSGGATVEDLEEQKQRPEKGYAYPPHVSTPVQEQKKGSVAKKPRRQGWSTGGQFQEEWNVLRELALGTMLGTIRAMVRQQMPTFAPHIEKILQRTSAKLGTEPIDPWNTTESSQGKETQHAPESTAAHPPLPEGQQDASSAIQGTAIASPSVTAQPRPNTQYRR